MDNDMLSSLLSDPAALQNAMQAVSGMLGGADSAEPSVSPGYDPTAELMEHALPVIGTIVQSGRAQAVRYQRGCKPV